MDSAKKNNIEMRSGYGLIVGAFVDMTIPGGRVQLSPTEAREVAHNLLQCAEGAVTDELVYNLHNHHPNQAEASSRMMVWFRNERVQVNHRHRSHKERLEDLNSELAAAAAEYCNPTTLDNPERLVELRETIQVLSQKRASLLEVDDAPQTA